MRLINLFLLASFLDLALTLIALGLGMAELNPLVAYVQAANLAVFKIAVAMLAVGVYALGANRLSGRWDTAWLICVAMMWLVVVWNGINIALFLGAPA